MMVHILNKIKSRPLIHILIALAILSVMIVSLYLTERGHAQSAIHSLKGAFMYTSYKLITGNSPIFPITTFGQHIDLALAFLNRIFYIFLITFFIHLFFRRSRTKS